MNGNASGRRWKCWRACNMGTLSASTTTGRWILRSASTWCSSPSWWRRERSRRKFKFFLGSGFSVSVSCIFLVCQRRVFETWATFRLVRRLLRHWSDLFRNNRVLFRSSRVSVAVWNSFFGVHSIIFLLRLLVLVVWKSWTRPFWQVFLCVCVHDKTDPMCVSRIRH